MFTGKRPPWRSLSIATDEPLPLPRPQTHAGSLRTERSFGVSFPNEGFETATKNDSMPDSSAGGLLAKDALVLGLANLQPENEDQRARQSALLGKLASVLDKIKALTVEVETQRHSRLTEEHKEIRKLGRKAEKELTLASEAFTAADVYAMNIMSAQESQTINLEHLRDAELRGEHLKRFHTDEELQKWNEHVDEEKELWRAISAMATQAVADRAQRQQDLIAQREKVAQLAAEESRIRAELKGTPTWDPELGLGQPGQRSLTSDIVRTMAVRD